jgi:spermidine synthase
MSAGWLAKALEHVDVAELEPAIVEIARAASSANADVLHANNVNLFLGDGREYLLTTRKSYDVIVSEPSNPYRAGVASLFTADFYRIVRKRLAPGGIFVQWQQGYEVDASVVLLALRSLREVFPFVEIWQAQESDIAFLASAEPRTYDVGLIRERARREPYLGAMRRTWLVEGVEGLLSHVYGSSAFVERLIAVNHPPVNTDDENLLEFSVARSVGKLSSSAASELFSTSLALGADEVSLQNGELDRGLVRALRHRSFIISGGSMPSEFASLRDARAALFESGCVGDGRMPLAPGSELLVPRDLVDAYAMGRLFALSGSAAAAPIIERLDAEGYAEEASFLRALQAQSAGRFEQALDHLEHAIVGLRRNALPLCELARQVVELATELAPRVPGASGRFARVLYAQPFAGYLAQTARTAAAQRLAFASGDPKLCVDALGAELRRPTWSLGFLSARLECLRRAQHPLVGMAEDDLVEYLGNAAGGYGIAVTSQSAERP